MAKLLNKRRLVEGELEVCAHRVPFWYDIHNTPRTTELVECLTEAAEERAKECITDGYVSGQLVCHFNEKEFFGWWDIRDNSPEEERPSRNVKPARICFDVTLKGYSAIDNIDEFDDEQASKTAERLISELVGWIVAPSKAALVKFLKKNSMMELLDGEPYAMSEASARYGREDGVDFIIDRNGKVIEGDYLKTVDSWRQLVADAEAFLS